VVLTYRFVPIERASVLETQIGALETQLNEEEEEARSVLQQWQDSYSELEEKLAMHEGSELADESAKAQEDVGSQLKEKDDQLQVALQTIQRDEKIVKQWEGKEV
jgi:hypothetical protein